MSIREEREKRLKKREDYLDGDKLSCVGCDRFVRNVNEDGLCEECEWMLE